MAYYMGKLSEAARRDIDLLRAIRNKFAHYPTVVTFDDEVVANQCRELKFSFRERADTPRLHFLGAVFGVLPSLFPDDRPDRPDHPRACGSSAFAARNALRSKRPLNPGCSSGNQHLRDIGRGDLLEDRTRSSVLGFENLRNHLDRRAGVPHAMGMALEIADEVAQALCEVSGLERTPSLLDRLPRAARLSTAMAAVPRCRVPRAGTDRPNRTPPLGHSVARRLIAAAAHHSCVRVTEQA